VINKVVFTPEAGVTLQKIVRLAEYTEDACQFPKPLWATLSMAEVSN
jgi:hypothetical protein